MKSFLILPKIAKAINRVSIYRDDVLVISKKADADALSGLLNPGLRVEVTHEVSSVLDHGESAFDVVVLLDSHDKDTGELISQRLIPGGTFLTKAPKRLSTSSILVRDGRIGRKFHVFRKSPLVDVPNFKFMGEKAYGFRLMDSGDFICPPVALSEQFDNPWIFRALIHSSWRIQDQKAREKLCHLVLKKSSDPRDRGAVLCVLGYQILEQSMDSGWWWSKLNEWLKISDESDPMVMRWIISLEFLAGELHLANDQHSDAKARFQNCASRDPLSFSPLLATKSVRACLRLAEMALECEDLSEAVWWWKRGMVSAESASQASWSNHFGPVENFPPCVLFELRQLMNLASVASYCLFRLRVATKVTKADVNRAWNQSSESRSSSRKNRSYRDWFSWLSK